MQNFAYCSYGHGLMVIKLPSNIWLYHSMYGSVDAEGHNQQTTVAVAVFPFYASVYIVPMAAIWLRHITLMT